MADPLCPNATEAYKRAGYSTNGKPETINRLATQLTTNVTIAARITELRAAVAAAALANLAGPDGRTFDAQAVLREWVIIATADPGELTKSRTHCCRHCYGIDHRYQWISAEEWSIAYARAIDENANRPHRSHAKPLPEAIGGFGFDRRKPPVESCPYCGGDGHVSTWIADTDRLSPAARKLFAGVKQTNSGIEIKTRDQDGALANLAKYYGLTTGIQIGNPDGSPLNPATVVFTGDAKEAAALYQKMMGGKG